MGNFRNQAKARKCHLLLSKAVRANLDNMVSLVQIPMSLNSKLR